ncbi:MULTISPECIES: methyltransferase [Streptomycetaceae]|uniref:Polyketide synthesis 8-O-methyltransferase n=1 Tax=Streptantibioticus cattleyicolor (strain ATCC 35852 / DSM 46488 / JCM 4925 / NBRC 14057 / NRRL 8057) TaxID=1003195 RepID=F8K3U8_STREN|nr:methyltransferase [Streptantibioticus cattleyicolor]AEW97641.1 polyketide synthesis 8-O-methyltransferase [Streptantibioticus cattleyicolor NRRL 8057 = DSM 46488]MYS62069.1 methyltransferase domain-containing protein [Streptomyces sp. SID5468]CCB77962.1 Polyketide synthesis 8-O-methyltransferase [Streptantibioticus cattleyicolor NRRL 8057 = DSM 46488]
MGHPVTPEAITRIATGFMASKQLFVACEVGMFAALAEGPLELDDLAARCGIPRRTARVLADGMTALGLLDASLGRYTNRPETQAYLSGPVGDGLRPFLRYWDRISYPAWQGLEQAVRTGHGVGLADLDEERQQIFSQGVRALTSGAAHALAEGFGLDRYRRMLDLGGGMGSFLVAALSRHPRLTGTLFDLPPVVAIARPELAAGPVGDRVEAVAGDMLTDPIPGGHDLVLMANVLHYFLPGTNVSLLTRVRTAVEPGTRLLLVDFWTDPTHTQPMMAALMAAEFLTNVGGDVYSAEEAEGWLTDSGWQPVGQQPLDGALSVLLATAV